ncbi:uncharacterized protein Z520_01089 [Fonsecaea multimorphosa CBS 102226]|uniref:Ketoreductase domain-containing protein n=1 Tax=Fonsecaea multimorphosa CBS 102226 TaxID=1442371 RepID=A0A0D2L0Q6_9EURO|nr:uncharacterized protein Z520_01089 [Fonsecaea multimorphosa CBS 102226]KIY02624.1 hypothetical protein Z520_01089 [Fonsecaea multimorphosa CBS 102226]
MMALPMSHPDFWTRALQFTPTIHRDVYPALDPESQKLQGIAKGKVVLVTGAGSGFGKGAVLQWAKAGVAGLILAGRRKSELDRTAHEVREIAPGVDVLAVSADVASEEDVRCLFDCAFDHFLKVDVVVHAAGVLGPVTNIGESPVKDWWKAFEINAKGAYLVAREFVSRTSQQTATFINTGTAASYFASPGQSAYIMSKLAVNMLLDQLHAGRWRLPCPSLHLTNPPHEYANVRVYNVHPGMAKSSVLRPELEIYARDTPALFGSLTVYLTGDTADFLRGRFIVANWDVDDLERHKDEIVADGLLKSQPFKGNIGNGGHFSS